MTKNTFPAKFMKATSSEDRFKFFLETFGETPLAHLIAQSASDIYGDLSSTKFYIPFIAAISSQFVNKRDNQGYEANANTLLMCSDTEEMRKHINSNGASERSIKLIGSYLQLIENESVSRHTVLTELLNSVVKHISKKLIGIEAREGRARSIREGDVTAEGPGFEVVVGPKMQNIVNYSGGRPAVLIIHDPRDGHFLLVERFSDHHKGYILEMPKAPPSFGEGREAKVNIALLEETGLGIRDLELIGEIWTDPHISMGVCDVYYGNFDLEENFKPKNPLIRSVKRLTEEGFYQSAYEKQMNCSLSLAAIAIWRAFESVRKKRISNQRRVRGGKGLDTEVEDDLSPDLEA